LIIYPKVVKCAADAWETAHILPDEIFTISGDPKDSNPAAV
jgi:hypothetical protein